VKTLRLFMAKIGDTLMPRLFPWMFVALWTMPIHRPGAASGPGTVSAEEDKRLILEIEKTADFDVTGDGRAGSWKTAEWIALAQRKGADPGYATDLKVLYSDSGLYFLFRCRDRTLTATLDADFLDLWHEDVVEVFLWPDERHPVYFEYELSPLDHELPLLIPNIDGNVMGWRPWHYEGERRTRHATSVSGGKKESGSAIQEWTAEIFVPFDLLKPLADVPPHPGSRWRANFYRCDYDTGQIATWSWQPVGRWFHDMEAFGTIVFK
jgi:hypothetical protein